MRGNSWCHHRLHQFFWHTQKRNRPVIMLISFIVPFKESWNVCSLPCSGYSVAGGAYIRHKQQGWNNWVTSKLYKFCGNTVGSWGFIDSQLSQTIPSDDKFMLITQAATMETWTLLWVKLDFGNSLASFSPIVEKRLIEYVRLVQVEGNNLSYLRCYPRFRDAPSFNFPVRRVHLTDINEYVWPRPIAIVRIIKHGTDWPRRITKDAWSNLLKVRALTVFGGSLFILDHIVARASLWSEIPNSVILTAPLIISGLLSNNQVNQSFCVTCIKLLLAGSYRSLRCG